MEDGELERAKKCEQKFNMYLDRVRNPEALERHVFKIKYFLFLVKNSRYFDEDLTADERRSLPIPSMADFKVALDNGKLPDLIRRQKRMIQQRFTAARKYLNQYEELEKKGADAGKRQAVKKKIFDAMRF